MPLLEIADGHLLADDWVPVAEDAPLPQAPAILSPARLRDPALAGHNGRLGLALDPGTQPEEIADLLPRLSLVQVVLPKPKDGRAFTQVRALREHHGFTGEIRATGHLLPDHARMLRRCGVTTVALPEGADLEAWRRSAEVVDIAYQPAQDEGTPLGFRRRRLRAA
ncbi:DUF934 domain-containing protein [Roseicella aquatilis]|nr:DUF934 domain-containing protein [Roseicella aquatilis]